MRDFIVKRIAAVIVPFICIYGFYVILHGSSSAGGSFAGGIILGIGFIAFATIYPQIGRRKISDKVLTLIESYGTLWYAIIGMVGILRGAPFLANKLAGVHVGDPGSLTSGGLIALLGLGVGIRVASTMITLFLTMRGEES